MTKKLNWLIDLYDKSVPKVDFEKPPHKKQEKFKASVSILCKEPEYLPLQNHQKREDFKELSKKVVSKFFPAEKLL